MTPKVSIIVPVYRVEPYLARCMASLAHQTLQEIEIILVDDGSPDRCPQMCDEYAAQDPRIRVVHKANAGLGFARNSGLELARGKYVGFVDSDDYVSLDMFETLYLAAEKYQADMVLAGYRFVGGRMYDNDAQGQMHCFDRTVTFTNEQEIQNLLLGVVGALPEEPDDSRYGASSCKNIYRREVLEENGIAFLSERKVVSEDLIFLIDFISHIRCAVGIPGAYYYYCRNNQSLSKSYRPDRFERNLVCVEEVKKRLPKSYDGKTCQLYTDRLLQSGARVACTQEINHASESGASYGSLTDNLKKICAHPQLQQTLKRYPWHRLPFAQAVFAFTMRFRLYGMQKILVSLRKKLNR